MTRSSRILAVVGLAAFSLTSCGAVSSSSTVFSVDGSNFSRDQLNSVINGLSKAGQVTVRNDAVDGTEMRSFVSAMIRFKATQNLLASLGKSVTDAERSAVAAQLQASAPKDLAQDVVDLLIDLNAVNAAAETLTAPSEKDLQAMYEASPASSGFLCARQITVSSKEKAVDVARQLSEGAKFADLAAKVSTDKASRENGGAVIGLDESPCTEIAAADDDASLGRVIAGALIDTPLDRTTGPVQDKKGWHIAVHRPWSEIRQAVTSAFAEKPGQSYVSGSLAIADVQVNSAYGTWNRVVAKVE